MYLHVPTEICSNPLRLFLTNYLFEINTRYLEEASIIYIYTHFKQRIWVQKKRLYRRIGHIWAFLFPSFILPLLTSTEFSIHSFIQFTYQFRMLKIDYFRILQQLNTVQQNPPFYTSKRTTKKYRILPDFCFK